MKKSCKEILEIVSKCIWWGISILTFALAAYQLWYRDIWGAIMLAIIAGIYCPIVLDKIFERVGGKPDYFYFITVLYGSLGWSIAFVLCTFFGDDYKDVLKILMYIVYLLFWFMTKDWDIVKKYIFFGIVYIVCVLLGYLSENMTEELIGFMSFIHNTITGATIDVNTWRFLVEGVLMPVKEAILTYIIFDTINPKKSESRNQVNGEKGMMKDNKKENASAQNHIGIFDDGIIIKNITSDIELETKGLCISIKRKESGKDTEKSCDCSLG